MTLNSHNKHTGFTLIEVMVALTIIAISLGALLSTSGSQANNAAYLKQKTIAHWVAVNELTLLSIEKKFPSLGEDKGSTSMANHDWYWIRKTEKVGNDNKNIRSVTFTVFADKNYQQNLTTLKGYVP